ncbi:peptidylprolyl isomerase [Oscillatoria sp. FACHB-1406]|uniref:peptidylprolyl isomerase n=1 Tax=Oscillatoria sp. FACHB-1406 TaxID=2692846 RepID=UPI0016863BEC|nr:peptidylprolyl isomerase [Oscillatoria sp. FACHB-1406]MBD2577875.1 peptidylprolyl isomerase [Oscillatoria sp. FACHB-1406]
MSAILQVGNQQIAAEQFVSLLKSSQLLPQLLREFYIEQAIVPIEPSAEELQRYCEKIAQKPENYGISPQKVQAIAPRQLKLERFKEETWGDRVETTFYNCREQLDRVLFSLIQSEDVEIIQEIYFRLQEGEASFARLASQYSQGPEAHTNGLVGPIELNNLHPKLAQVLKVSQPGQISPPLRIDKWLTIVRLERYIPAQFDEKMRQRLLDELFEAWLQEKIARARQSGAVNFQATAEIPPIAFEDASNSEELAVALPEGTEDRSLEASSQPARALPAKSSGARNGGRLLPMAMLGLMAFGVGVVTIEAIARLTTRPSTAFIPGAAPVPNVKNEEAFREAVNHATKAAVLTQTAQSQSEWQLVVSDWQTAIALMQRVPKNLDNFAIAREKAGEYQKNLDYASARLTQSADAFHEAVNNAMSAATLTQSARSTEEWQTVAERWQKAISFMQAVPDNNPKYEVARDRIGEYQKNLDYAQSRATKS